MNRRIFNTGIALIAIGFILIILGFLFGERYFLFDYYILWKNSKLIYLIGILLFVLGAVFSIIGAFIKEEIKTISNMRQKPDKELCSGTCPVCHQEFETTAEIIKGYYVFNCNKCNSKLRVKKLAFFPVG